MNRQGLKFFFKTFFATGLILCSSPAVRADISTHFGLSPHSIGMGNAVAAVSHDYGAVYYNPAGLALSSESTITFGYLGSIPRVKIKTPRGKEGLFFTNGMNVPLFGYRQNIGPLLSDKGEKNIVLGLCVGSSDNLKTGTLLETYLYEEPQVPVFGRVQDMLVMSVGLGIELHKYILVGAGLRFAATYDAVNISAKINVLNQETIIDKLEVNADTEILPIFGLLLRPSDQLRLAAVWRRGGAPIKLVGKGGGGLLINKLKLPWSFSLALAFQDFYTPNEYAGAIAYSFTERFLLALEITFAEWSKYDVPYGTTPPGEPFKNIFIPRIGAEYAFNENLKIQMGYYWQPSPIKTIQPFTNYLDTDEHVFSIGLEYDWLLTDVFTYPLKLQLYFQYQHLPRRILWTLLGPTSIWGVIANVGAVVQFRFR